MKVYIYNTDTLVFSHMLMVSMDVFTENIKEGTDYTLTPPPDYKHVWRWVEDKWVVLPPINNPNIYYGDEYEWDKTQNQWVISPELDAYKLMEDQSVAWENIKQRRYEAVTSGVYIESVDKWLHTDEVSVTSYSTIAGMIALNNYEPVQWKAMDNTWLLLTEQLLKELQTAMSAKTNANYAVAEQHKAAMIEATNPLEYDYSEGWV